MRTPDKDSLDDWLDKALQQYGNADPRIGLESRILANLEAAGRRRVLLGNSYGWLLAGASAVALLIGIWLGTWHRAMPATKTEPTQQIAEDFGKQIGPKITSPAQPRHTGRKLPPRRQTVAARDAELARGPRLDHFPSSRSPSEQEVLLTRYASQFPTEARLIAQEQDKFQQEIQQAEQELKNSSLGSESQER
jgi:hypothetical protein